MAANQTNSNSITKILIEKLNNRQSGFRYEMIKNWNLPCDTEFVDGTYRTLPFAEMKNYRVDIIGYSGGNEKVLIEVKAGRREKLQYSQTENGAYAKTADQNGLTLFFIIPDKYDHENDIPSIAIVYKWSVIYKYALEFDNTGLAKQIKFFVEKTPVSEKLKEGEVITRCEPTTIENVLDKYNRIKDFMEEFVEQNKDLIKYDYRRGKKHFGMHYKIINPSNKQQVLEDVWIGLLSLKDFIKQNFPYIYRDQTLQEIATGNDFFIWFGFYDDDSSYFFKAPNNEDYYAVPWNDGKPGKDYFFPIKIETDNQEKFNKLLDDTIKKVLKHIGFKNKVKKTK